MTALDPPALSRRWLAVELLVAFATAALFVASCMPIHTNALTRAGQTSLLAAVSYRMLLFGIPLVVGVAAAARWCGAAACTRIAALACAAVSGLASAAVAGGILALLHQTPYGLGALNGDVGRLAAWAVDLRTHGLYPPMQAQVIHWLAELFGVPTAYAIKPFQIIGLAAMGPLTYGAWRLLLRPGWAIGIGVASMLPLVDPYRVYPTMILAIFIPVIVKFFDVVRRSPDDHPLVTARAGVLFGIAFGLLVVMYPGWLHWSLPGLFAVGIYVFPWRRGRASGIALVVATAVVFGLFAFHYGTDVVTTAAKQPIRDGYTFFDALVEPAYFAMWRTDLPGQAATNWWPLPGELGGVGLFTVIIIAGIGGAIWLGKTRTPVIAIAAMLASTWLYRMYLAHRFYETKLLQLYPRTSAELVYGSLLLTGYALYFAVERARARSPADSPWRARSAVPGLLTASLLVFLSAGSAIVDRYSPSDDQHSLGYLSWLALKSAPLTPR